MADVKIRDLDDHLVAYFKQRALRRGVSLEEELRRTLEETRREEREQLLAELEKHQDALRAKYGVMADSTPGIRAERDGEPDA